MPLQLFATGKRDLKTFSQINIAPFSSVAQSASQENEDTKNIEIRHQESITGQHQYAALYLNEILWRLLPTEDPMPILWQHYQNSLYELKKPLTTDELRLCLRQFESYLFDELGFSLALHQDSLENSIEPEQFYRFLPDVGIVPILHTENSESMLTQAVFKGKDILMMVEQGLCDSTLTAWSRLHRQLIDHMLDYQPLQSRLLWQQQQRYQL